MARAPRIASSPRAAPHDESSGRAEVYHGGGALAPPGRQGATTGPLEDGRGLSPPPIAFATHDGRSPPRAAWKPFRRPCGVRLPCQHGGLLAPEACRRTAVCRRPHREPRRNRRRSDEAAPWPQGTLATLAAPHASGARLVRLRAPARRETARVERMSAHRDIGLASAAAVGFEPRHGLRRVEPSGELRG